MWRWRNRKDAEGVTVWGKYRAADCRLQIVWRRGCLVAFGIDIYAVMMDMLVSTRT